MTVLENLKNRLGQFKESIKIIAVDDEIYQKRIQTCKECPELFEVFNNCKKCGCFVHAKAKLQNQSCPLGKW